MTEKRDPSTVPYPGSPKRPPNPDFTMAEPWPDEDVAPVAATLPSGLDKRSDVRKALSYHLSEAEWRFETIFQQLRARRLGKPKDGIAQVGAKAREILKLLEVPDVREGFGFGVSVIVQNLEDLADHADQAAANAPKEKRRSRGRAPQTDMLWCIIDAYHSLSTSMPTKLPEGRSVASPATERAGAEGGVLMKFCDVAYRQMNVRRARRKLAALPALASNSIPEAWRSYSENERQLLEELRRMGK